MKETKQNTSKKTAASKTSPVENPPQFVVLGSDDNKKAQAVKWISNVLNKSRNKNGSRMYMSFYINTDQGDASWDASDDPACAVYNVYKAGHEVGNHTSTHLYCVAYAGVDEDGAELGKRADLQTIRAEIQRVEDVLNASGIPKEHLFAFRTPFLRYSELTFCAVSEFGYLYDCSINSAQDNKAGDCYFPYTLDTEPDENGNYAPDNDADRNSWGKTAIVGKHDGLWELPCTKIAIDPQDFADVENILKRKYGDDFEFDGYITGLDWDLWNEAELDGAQTVRALMHTLKESLKGNRAPFTLGVHSQFYAEAKTGDFPNITAKQRREAFEEFIKQASKLENVYFVSGDMVIRWMQNPVSAPEFNPENYKRAPYTQKTAPVKIFLSNNSVNEGVLEIGELTAANYNIDVTHKFSVIEGADIFEIDGNLLKFKSAKKANAAGYDVCIKAAAGENPGSIEQKFKIKVNKIYNTEIEFINTGKWDCEQDNAGSGVSIKSHAPLETELKLGGGQEAQESIYIQMARQAPFADVFKTYEYPLTGLKNIEVFYTCGRDVILGIGYSEKKDKSLLLNFGFGVRLPASSKEKTLIFTPDMFDILYFEAADKLNSTRIPGSLEDALWMKGLRVSFSGIEENQTANIKVYSLKLTGIPDSPI